jgi:chromosome segregation ATPase
MAVTLKNLFGHATTVDELPAELRAILAEMRRERTAFESAHTRAQESSQQLQQLVQPLAEAQQTVTELRSRVKALERLVPVLATLDEQTEAVAKMQRRTEIQVTHSADEAKRLRADVTSLRGTMEEALALKHELAGFLELGGGLKALRLDADRLTGDLRDMTQGVERMRERQDEVRRLGESAANRLAAFEERQQQSSSSTVAAESRLAELGAQLEELADAAAEAVQTRRQLGALKSLADSVSQKVALLEQQREMVERATGQVSALHDLVHDVEGKIRAGEERVRDLGVLDAKVQELHGQHRDLLERADEIATRQDEARRADEDLRARLAALRDDVQRTVQRFELENQGLEAVGQRIQDLRGGLTGVEERVRALDESTRAIADVQSRADGLTTRLDHIADAVGELEPQADRVRGLEGSLGRLTESVESVTQRVAWVEKAQPAVDAMLQEVSTLAATREAVRDAIEQIQTAESEIARVREGQAATKAWLAGVTESVSALRDEVADLEELAPSVSQARTEAERVAEAMGQIDARRDLVEGLDARLATLAAASAQLEERSAALVGRMNAADERFQLLAAHAEEASRIERLVPSAVATIERAERRAADVDAAVASLESRTGNLEGVAERTRTLAQELDQRQAALDRASDHLERASQLREQAAASAQQLADRSTELTGGLATAGQRLGELQAALDELDGRAGTLRFTQKRMALFEERLAKWEALDGRLARTLDQVGERQTTLDALQADMHRLFGVAERTVEDVRSIAAARQEVAETRTLLETVLGLVGETHDAASGLDHRKRQVERAEERLGRVEAMLDELQQTLESIHAQKAALEQAVEQAGALQFETRQAEALVGALREERALAHSVRSVIADLRREGVAQTA